MQGDLTTKICIWGAIPGSGSNGRIGSTRAEEVSRSPTLEDVARSEGFPPGVKTK